MLRIVIDARSVSNRKSGIGNTVEALLARLVPLASDVRFLILRHCDTTGKLVDHERVSELRFPGETKSTATVFALGIAHRFAEYDLYHSPADLIPLAIGCPWVVTIHDLMWVEAPKLASAFLPVRIGNGIWYRTNMRRSIGGARRVIAISRATADRIERLYPEASGKVRVVQHGLDLERYSGACGGPRSELDRLIGPSAEYSLVIGQGSPYKNHPAMIRAFMAAIPPSSDHKLVLVRRFSRIDFEMQRLLREPEVAQRVVTISEIDDRLLFTLYRHAKMLLFASLYEGFGLPALEAMAFGVPVVASTAPALLEVTGDAALHADPRDPGDLADKIGRLDRDRALRARLVEAGKSRVREFSWERAARLTLDVYREAITG